jgi:hypothetical protein
MTRNPSPSENRTAPSTGTSRTARPTAAAADHGTPSAADRQRTCAACGAAFAAGERTGVEVLLDGEVRYIAVHPDHTTYSPVREQRAATRLREAGGPGRAA